MKILVVSLENCSILEDSNFLTGAGSCIDAIIKAEAKVIKVSYWSISTSLNNINTRLKILNAIIKNFFYIAIFYIKNFKIIHEMFGMKDLLLNIIILGKFSRKVKKEAPDIIHFHGTGQIIQLLSKYCEYTKRKHIITIHLYLGKKNNEINTDLIMSESKYKWLSTVSTGIKKCLQSDYPNRFPNRIKVILNGTNYSIEKPQIDIRKRYQINNNSKILLCIGSINERKNQIQIVKAFSLLPEEYKKQITIIFCGKDFTNNEFELLIKKMKLEKYLITAGTISQTDLKSYYAESEGVITTSYHEGFSMVFLEAMVYGLPLIVPKGLESNDDLNDSKIVTIIEERTDKAVADSMKTWFEKEWDKDYIRIYSKNFSMDTVVQNYLNYYKDIIKWKE